MADPSISDLQLEKLQGHLILSSWFLYPSLGLVLTLCWTNYCESERKLLAYGLCTQLLSVLMVWYIFFHFVHYSFHWRCHLVFLCSLFLCFSLLMVFRSVIVTRHTVNDKITFENFFMNCLDNDSVAVFFFSLPCVTS